MRKGGQLGDRAGIEAGSTTWAPALKATVMGYLMSHPGELASPDLKEDARFPALKKLESPVRALLAQPLKVDGRVTGMIAVSNSQPGREWSEGDVRLMGIVASHSASVIEKARLRVEEEAKRRLELEKEALEQTNAKIRQEIDGLKKRQSALKADEKTAHVELTKEIQARERQLRTWSHFQAVYDVGPPTPQQSTNTP